MSTLPPPPPPPPPSGRGPSGRSGPGGSGAGGPKQGGQQGERPRTPGTPGRTGPGLPRWSVWVLLGVLALVLFGQRLIPQTNSNKVDYSVLRQQIEDGKVESFTVNNNTLKISGEYKNGDKIESTAPPGQWPSDADQQLFAEQSVKVEYKTPTSQWVARLLPLLA